MITATKNSTWSGDSCCCRSANNLAWSGCNRALDRRRGFVSDGVGDSLGGDVHGDILIPDETPGMETNAFGDGEACIESMPESPVCCGSMYNEFLLLISFRWSYGRMGKIKLWPSASPLGESFAKKKKMSKFWDLRFDNICSTTYLTGPHLKQWQWTCWFIEYWALLQRWSGSRLGRGFTSSRIFWWCGFRWWFPESLQTRFASFFLFLNKFEIRI